MEEDVTVSFDDGFLVYSLLYSGVSIVFGLAVLIKFLNSELRLGLRSVLSLILLFVGEPFCQFLIKGHWGVAVFTVGCLVLYTTLPASHLDGKDKTVLVTGADFGFGHALVKRLDSLGMQVYAACLDASSSGAYNLRSTCSSRLRLLEMNVTDDKQVQETFQVLKNEVGNKGLWGLVNNAGVWYCAEADMMPWNLFREVIEVDLLGSVRVTKMLLPLIQQAKGRIVFMSSVAGKIPVPYFSAYSTAKSGIEAFADVLRYEMKKWQVCVSVIKPNCFYTESIMRRADIFQRLWDDMDNITKQRYGRDYFDAVFDKYNALASTFPRDTTSILQTVRSALLSRRPCPSYVPDRSVEFLLWLYNLLPSFLKNRLVETIDVITPMHVKPSILYNKR